MLPGVTSFPAETAVHPVPFMPCFGQHVRVSFLHNRFESYTAEFKNAGTNKTWYQ